MSGEPALAGVAEWYTRTVQNRIPKGLEVRVLSPVQKALYGFDHDLFRTVALHWVNELAEIDWV